MSKIPYHLCKHSHNCTILSFESKYPTALCWIPFRHSLPNQARWGTDIALGERLAIAVAVEKPRDRKIIRVCSFSKYWAPILVKIGFRNGFGFLILEKVRKWVVCTYHKIKMVSKANFKAVFKAKIFAPESGPCILACGYGGKFKLRVIASGSVSISVLWTCDTLEFLGKAGRNNDTG